MFMFSIFATAREVFPLQFLNMTTPFLFSLKSPMLKQFQNLIQFILSICLLFLEKKGKSAFAFGIFRAKPASLVFLRGPVLPICPSPIPETHCVFSSPCLHWIIFMDKQHFTSSSSVNTWISVYLLSRAKFPLYVNKPHVDLKKYRQNESLG